MKKKFTHLVSINLEILSNEETHSEEELTTAINDWVKKNKGNYKGSVEWLKIRNKNHENTKASKKVKDRV